MPRLRSIDLFRGATIAAMVLVNAQFSYEDSYRQLAHAAWNGWTFADTIYPCFLFIVGVSLTLSTAARVARGEDRTQLLAHAFRRSLLLFACGVAIDFLRVPAHDFLFFGFQQHLQLTGVLQKIAVCYLLAFLIFLWTGPRGVIAGIVGLNLLYLFLLYLYPVPGCGPGSLTSGCNFPGYVDQTLAAGFRWNSSAFDPDGPGSILPAVTSVLFGVLAGYLLLAEQNLRQRVVLASGRGACPDCFRRVALGLGADQQAAVDHVFRRPDGGSSGNGSGLLHMALRWLATPTLAQAPGGLWVERGCGLPHLPARGAPA